MITETTNTTVVKNKSTVRDQEFWSHVESVAAQSRQSRGLTHAQAQGGASVSKDAQSSSCANGTARNGSASD
jgi:hypothetical protein